jgi:hypothetical protein
MQPYLLPYAGYWRLLQAADVFVVFDCVQFLRRGRIHRCELPDGSWLTLPLAPAPQETPISAMRLAADARARFDERLRAQPWIAAAQGPAAERVRGWLAAPLDGRPLADLLLETLHDTAALLGLPARIERSSAFGLDPALRGEQRVIAAVRAVGGAHYVNSPGGRALYDAGRFAEAGLRLSFLAPYEGAFRYLLPALLRDEPELIAQDIRRTTLLLD